MFFFFTASYAQENGDAIVIGQIAQPRTLIPFLASDSASGSVCSFLYNGLVKYDKDLKLVGDLAESWEVLEGGKRIIFHLRKDVLWHDDTPFTAEDVEFTFQKIIDPQTPTPYSEDFKRVEQLLVRDPYTIEVIYKEPFSPALSSWGMSIVPKHCLEKEDIIRTSFARNPIGTGPYRFRKWLASGKIELGVWKKYFEGSPHIDRVIFRLISDDATMFLELLTQGVDNTSLTPLQYLKHAQSRIFKNHLTKFKYPSNSFLYVGYNLNHQFLRDVQVRKALNYAVNKQEIIQAVYLGQAESSHGPFTQESWAYDFSASGDPFDPARARLLLQQAGFSDADGDGILEKNGTLFQITLFTNQGNLQRQMSAEIIQKRLADVGVKVEIRIIEWAVFIDEIIGKRKFDAVLLGWNLARDPDLYDIFHSSKTKPGEFNFGLYQNSKVDALLIEARREFDIEKRKKLYYQIRQIIYDEQPYMFLCSPHNLSALQKRFRGIAPALGGYWYNFIDWWVPKKEQKYTFIP